MFNTQPKVNNCVAVKTLSRGRCIDDVRTLLDSLSH